MRLLEFSFFRKENGIKQQELADFLGISRSFLSLIETGKSPCPNDKIDKILDRSEEMGWNSKSFNPAYYRLSQLCRELASNAGRYDARIRPEAEEGILNIPQKDILDIKHGKLGITSEIAGAIVLQHPDVNVEWLLYGNGEIFRQISNDKKKDEVWEKIYADISDIKKELARLTRLLEKHLT